MRFMRNYLKVNYIKKSNGIKKITLNITLTLTKTLSLRETLNNNMVTQPVNNSDHRELLQQKDSPKGRVESYSISE